MVSFLWQVLIAVLQITLGFYGFWFVWRVLLPVLPGPENRDERIAPYALYLTDPFVKRLCCYLRLNEWLAALLGLLVVSSLSIGVAYLSVQV